MVTQSTSFDEFGAAMTARSSVDVNSPYHGTPTRDVLAALEHYRYLLTGIQADLEDCPESWDHPEQTLSFVRFHITEATAEPERRERLTDRPGTPPWPQHRRTPRVDVDSVKRRLSVPDWLESRAVVLLPYGKEWRARCPFPDHEDRTPCLPSRPAADFGSAMAASGAATWSLSRCSSTARPTFGERSRTWRTTPVSSRCWRRGRDEHRTAQILTSTRSSPEATAFLAVATWLRCSTVAVARRRWHASRTNRAHVRVPTRGPFSVSSASSADEQSSMPTFPVHVLPEPLETYVVQVAVCIGGAHLDGGGPAPPWRRQRSATPPSWKVKPGWRERPIFWFGVVGFPRVGQVTGARRRPPLGRPAPGEGL